MIPTATITQLKTACPMPWYLDQDDDSGIRVKDSHGYTIFFEDYGSVPDEAPSSVLEGVVERSRAMAYFLMALSEDYSKSKTPTQKRATMTCNNFCKLRAQAQTLLDTIHGMQTPETWDAHDALQDTLSQLKKEQAN